MKTRLLTSLLLIALTSLFISGNAVNADQVNTPYDLTGTWVSRLLDVQRSFCDGSVSREMVEIEINIVQSGDEITMVFLDESDAQIFEGRTSNYSIGVESNDQWQVTVLSGRVSQDANKIFGNIVFFDKHECPDAETGWARYVLSRITEGQ
jgi:hypothetical protein